MRGLEFAGGAVANVTAQPRIDRARAKNAILQQHEYISLDYGGA